MKTRLLNLGALLLLVAMLVPAMPAAAVSSPAGSVAAAKDVQVTPESDGVTVELTLPSYNVQDIQNDGVTYQQITVDGERWAQAGEPGAPQLPERGLLLAVPPTGEVTVQVLEAEQRAVPGSFRLAPAPTAELVETGADAGASLETRWTANARAYGQDSWQPAAPAEITQEGWMRGYRFVRLALRPFQANPASGGLRVTPDLRVRLSFSQPAEAQTPTPDPIYEPIFEATFANFDQAAAWQTRPEPVAAPASAVERSETTGNWVKLTVSADRVYKVTYSKLLAAGVPAATLDSLNPLTFRLLDDGQEQAIYVEGEADTHFNTGDYIIFYGRRNTAPLSSDDNVYWLTWGGANGTRMAAVNGTPGSATFATTLLTTVHAEQNTIYKQQRPFPDWLQPISWDNWYWENVVTNKTITLDNLKVASPVTINPTLEVWMAGDNEQANDYRVDLQLNGQAASPMSWTNTKALAGTQTLPGAALVNGTNQIWMAPASGLGNPYPSVWLDWINLTYQYSGDYIPGATFTNPNAGTWRYSITNSPVAAPWVLDVSTPAQPKRITGAIPTTTGSTYTITWQAATTASNRFLVARADEPANEPAAQVYVDAGLTQPQQVDYLMITHSSLVASVQPLVAMHQAEGMTVRVVNVQDIYDTFSDGSVSAEAIQDYLAYAYSNYTAPVPSFVLLIGDGTIDFRGYRFGQFGHPNLVPPYVGSFDAWGGVSISDNAYAWLQGSDLLGEMIISRLAVNSASEAQVVVSKITNYNASFPVGRSQSTLWISDNPDNDNPNYGTQFYMATEDTIQQLDPSFTASRVYYCNPSVNVCPGDPWYYTDVTAAKAAVVSNFSLGHLFVHYAGHGSYTTWAHEQLFRSYWVSQLTNGASLPFLLVSSCTNGYFASEEFNAMDEVLLRTQDRGTIGGFAGVTFDTLHPQSVLLGNFVDVVMHDQLTQPGVAAAVARAISYAELPPPENERMAAGHALSGDPAMYLMRPQRCTRGDIDCDGDIDIVDVQRVAALWNATAGMPSYNPRADLAPNGRIDVNDIIQAADLWRTLP